MTAAVLRGTVKWTCMKTEQSKAYEHHINYGLPYQHRNHYWSHDIPQHDCRYLESTALSPLSVRDTLCPGLILATSTSSNTLESAGTLPFQGPCNTWKCVPVNNVPSVIAKYLDWAMAQLWLLQCYYTTTHMQRLRKITETCSIDSLSSSQDLIKWAPTQSRTTNDIQSRACSVKYQNNSSYKT